MMLIHGEIDAIVPFAEAEIFHDALILAGVPSLLRCLYGAGHGWLVEQTEVEIGAFFKNIFMPDQAANEQKTRD